MSEAPAPEFSRMVDLRQIGDGPLDLAATPEERAALAERFALVRIDRLEATLTLEPEGRAVDAAGTLRADIVQSCAISGEDLPVTIEEPLTLRFVPAGDMAAADPDEEVELEEEELDEIPYEGTAFDLGEAVAQSLALAIDPYATGPEAERVREEHDLTEPDPQGPLQQALGAALKKG